MTKIRFNPSTYTVIPPDPDIVSILRLFLEKYDTLEAEDRKTISQAIRAITNPLMIVNTESTPQSVLDEREIESHNTHCEEFLARDRKKKDPTQ